MGTAIVSSESTTPEKKSTAICEHIKDNGLRCGSPALRGRHFCYFHSRAHNPTGRFGRRNYRVAVPEVGESLIIALTHVMQALATGDVPPKTANAMLYALSLAGGFQRAKTSLSSSDIAGMATEISPSMEEALGSLSGPSVAFVEEVTDGHVLYPELRPPQPAKPALTDFQLDRLCRHLMTDEEIGEIRETLGDGARNPDYPEASRRITAHWDAVGTLEDHGLRFDDPYNQRDLLIRRAKVRAQFA
jgi:hypothetical protein